MEANKSEPLFIYLRSKPPVPGGKGAPVACMAYSVNRTESILYYAFSTHNPVDVFNRRKAREVAAGRFKAHPHQFKFASLVGPHATMTDIFAKLGRYYRIAPDDKTPTKARKALIRFAKQVEQNKDRRVADKAVDLLEKLGATETE